MLKTMIHQFLRKEAINDNEKKVLAVLAEAWGDEEYEDEFPCLGFARLIDDTKLDRKTVRRACRSLKRKGLAQFVRGLWTEDGEPAGAGYSATKEGADIDKKRKKGEC